MGVGACQILEFRYREAFGSLLEARGLAISTGSDLELGAIEFNLSSLYLQVRDSDSALGSAVEGLAAIHSLTHPYYETQLLLQLGRIHAALNDSQGPVLFARAIEAARAQGDLALEARGWDLLGEARLNQHQMSDAERALEEAYRLRLRGPRADLPFSYGLLGALKLEQGDLESADRFTTMAIAAHAGAPKFLLEHQKGKIALARGNVDEALRHFSAAIDLAAPWWREVLPAASALTGANVDLQRQIYDSFVETAAQKAARTGETHWKVESLQALEMNRAASLRRSLALGEAWRKGLSLEYWELLARLRVEENRMTQSGARTSAKADQLHLQLTEMEAKAGMVPLDNFPENFRTQTSLIHFQEVLSNSELSLATFWETDIRMRGPSPGSRSAYTGCRRRCRSGRK